LVSRVPFTEDDTVSPFLKFLTEDWYFAIPMILMSLTALTLVFWRIFLNMNAKTDMGQFLPVFQQKLEREGIESALRYCRAQQGLIPRRLFVAGLETSKQGLSAMRRAMANAIELEIVPDLNFLLPPILAIAKIATMVGLLGTVISMTNTFNKIQEAEGGNVTSHAGAIGLALYATALGLVTAIPLVFAHVLFKAWIAQFEVKMKNAAQKLLVLVQAGRPATGQPHTPLKPVAMEPAATSPRK
jgi:biopolymer transport protein ExbB